MAISWRRNLAVLFLVQLLSTVGFSLIFPFLPLYVRELGAASGGSIEFWAGLVFSAQAFTMMVFSPLWGAFADRRGRKLMLERATIGGAFLLAAMGFVQNAEQLVLLRTLQGAITGVVAAANALVAATTPRQHTGFALGLLNMARWSGVAGGPLIGGLLAESFGYRQSFWITGVLLGLAGLAVVFLVQEDFTPVAKEQQVGFWASYRGLFAAPGMGGLYGLTFLRSLGATLLTPIVALYVLFLNGGQEAGTAALTGLVIGASALTSAVSAVYLGRLGDRVGHTKVLIGSALAAMVLYAPQAWAQSAYQLVLLQALSGFAIGGLVPSLAALPAGKLP
jgi:DHA1 family multidrug resistance protein-like MFS transporter